LPNKNLLSNNAFMRYATMGTQILITIVLFTFAGYKIDKWLNTLPVFIILLSLIGVAVALYFAVKDLMKK